MRSRIALTGDMSIPAVGMFDAAFLSILQLGMDKTTPYEMLANSIAHGLQAMYHQGLFEDPAVKAHMKKASRSNRKKGK